MMPVLVDRAAATQLPTAFGHFQAWGYRSAPDDREHLALTMGEPARATRVLVHFACTSGDVLRSDVCGCRTELHAALEQIAGDGQGVLVYVAPRRGRGPLCAPPTPGDRAIGELILRDLGIARA